MGLCGGRGGCGAAGCECGESGTGSGCCCCALKRERGGTEAGARRVDGVWASEMICVEEALWWCDAGKLRMLLGVRSEPKVKELAFRREPICRGFPLEAGDLP